MDGVRALVVDDEDDMRALVEAYIESENQGLSVVGHAAGGREALSRVAELDPDAVVLDHRMPDMTGVEAARTLLADRPDLRVILFSAYLDADTIADARAAGIDHVLPKSDLNGLISALRAPRP